MNSVIRHHSSVLLVLSVYVLGPISVAQTSTTNATDVKDAKSVLFSDSKTYFSPPTELPGRRPSEFRLPLDIWQDQKRLWTTPAHFNKFDLRWILPLTAATGFLIGTDHHVMTLIHANPTDRSRSVFISDGGLAALAGLAVGSFGIGSLTYNKHLRESGRLSTEALADTFLAVEALKIVTARQRPNVSGAQGLFWHQSPLNSSFPSEHAALAWTAATVTALEYPGPITRWTAYGLASLVSLSRITAQQHFPSDVLVGAASGYLIGRFVYYSHHNDRLTDRTGATPVGTLFVPSALASNVVINRAPRQVATGSPYVPLDSWIYPALRRLAALGYVPDQVSDLAPWTRTECLQLVQEAADFASRRDVVSIGPQINNEALGLISALQQELSVDSLSGGIIQLESLYTRTSLISGTPLTDSYHFGQTITNDFGRPFERGINNVSGFSTYAVSGPFFAYFRGEYQYSGDRAADTASLRQFIAGADGNPVQNASATATTNGFQTQDMYAGVKLGFENVTFGKQSLWWGPGEESAFSFTNNAQPFYSLRLAQGRPLILPGVLSRLGKIRTEFLFGKLSGHQWPPRPYVNAQKISLALTDNFEIGFTRSAFFGGVGHPLTFGNFTASLVSTASTGTGGYGAKNDPGDRHSGFDFRYRIPGVRRYLTIFSDSYADDDPNPLDNPKRSAWGPGLYLAQMPGLKKLDFRFETYSTLLYRQDMGGNFIYYNGDYHDAYTNKGYLLGSWVGRDSRAYSSSSTYWLSARSTVKAQYRQIKAGAKFLPGGGTQTQGSVAVQWGLTPELMVTANAQYERYNIPILGKPEKDMLGSVEVVFTPHRRAF